MCSKKIWLNEIMEIREKIENKLCLQITTDLFIYYVYNINMYLLFYYTYNY